MLTPPRPEAQANWKTRFRAAAVLWAAIARNNPRRGLVCTNRDGVYQLYGWDVDSGDLHQLTTQQTGVAQGMISSDGESVYYHQDQYGSEIGHYVRLPFVGGEASDITPDLLPYASFSISQSVNGAVTGFMSASLDGFKIYTMVDGEAPQVLFHSERIALGPQLSYDGEIAVVRAGDQSGSLDTRLIALERRTGRILREAGGQPDVDFSPGPFSPRKGDTRMLVMTSETGFNRPFVWDVSTGERRVLALAGIPGDVTAWDWSPDAGQLLLCQLYQACYQLYVYDLNTDEVTRLQHPAGVYNQGYFTAAGEIFATWQNSTHPSRLIALDPYTGVQTRTVLAAGPVPEGHPFQSVWFDSTEAGTAVTIQAWLARPEGEGPHPTILHVHGGPTAVMTDLFSPVAQAWVDHGFAYLSVNYRGSTTFGKAFEKAIWGQLGKHEVADIAAACQWLVEQGIADPSRILMVGGSYGGYLTLLSMGRRPELFAGGVAVAAIADWRLLYEDAAETLRGYFRALLGGTPDEQPAAYQAGSPLTYAENVQTPLLIIQGRNDTRCPARQMEVYVDQLRAHQKSVEIVWFDAGHGVLAQEQQIDQFSQMLQFVCGILEQGKA